MSDLFKDIPEFVEVGSSPPVISRCECTSQLMFLVQLDIGESLTARTETLCKFTWIPYRIEVISC